MGPTSKIPLKTTQRSERSGIRRGDHLRCALFQGPEDDVTVEVSWPEKDVCSLTAWPLFFPRLLFVMLQFFWGSPEKYGGGDFPWQVRQWKKQAEKNLKPASLHWFLVMFSQLLGTKHYTIIETPAICLDVAFQKNTGWMYNLKLKAQRIYV